MKGPGKHPVFCDFEFNRVTHPDVNLVSCCTYSPRIKEKKKWWLHNDRNTQAKLKDYIWKNFSTVIGFADIAEARSFLSLGLDPLDFDWIDLHLEYRMLTNHNDFLQWGLQLVDGRVRPTKKPKPKFERTEQDKGTGFKATHSLAEATYKLCGVVRDTDHKTKMRNLIISDPEEFTPQERDAILKYNMDDVIFLPTLLKRTKEEFKRVYEKGNDKDAPPTDMAEYIREAKVRGRYSAHTAIMEKRGYPIDIEKTKNFSKHVSAIVYQLQKDINDQFPEMKPFRWNKNANRYTWNQKVTKDWIKEHHANDLKNWMKTEKKDLSLSLEAFERFYAYKHDYPRGNFGAQIVRFLKMKQSIYGFVPTTGEKRNFWDSVGPDNRVRPYMNIFGAQSSRSQPAATGFIFLKPAWMRALVLPAPGHFIASIDYGSQEFFTGALLSKDKKMIEAYLSGDPYMAFAIISGQVPVGGRREDYRAIRDLCKSTVLGISYLMTKYGLAIKLTADTGRVWTEDEAQEQIDLFVESFEEYDEWRKDITETYEEEVGSHIKLPCGWYMWGDNPNHRSVGNVPVQGFGASVMRYAVDLAHRNGIKILFTLHDALYFEGKISQEKQIVRLAELMRIAYAHYIPDKELKNKAIQIKLDPFAWSPDYKKDSEITVEGMKIPVSNLYIDDRSESEYLRFSQYFEKAIEDDL